MYTLEDLVNDKELTGIINDYWKDYVKHRNLKFVVNPSIPIIWFGDLCEYWKHEPRIVTVGINPSWWEFSSDEDEKERSFHRFRDAEELVELNDMNEDEKRKILIKSYNRYFKKDAADGKYHVYEWFHHENDNLDYEKILTEFFSASYGYHKADCTAIHVDYRTALATDPAWSGLSAGEQAQIKENHKKLFMRLYSYLKPQIMLFSAKEDDLMKGILPLFEENGMEYTECAPEGESRKGRFVAGYKINDNLFIYGTNNFAPFAGVTEDYRNRRFAAILEDYKNRK